MREQLVQGQWTQGQYVDQLDAHTTLTIDTFKGAPFISRGVGSFVRSVASGSRANAVLALNVSRPGMHALFYAFCNGKVAWDERRWPLDRWLRENGSRAKPIQVLAGEVVLTDGHKVMTMEAQPRTTVTALDITLEEAIDEFTAIVLRVTEEMWTMAGRPRIAVMVSAGTDSTLGACALRAVGADIHGVTVGRDLDDFDPKYAHRYAKQLGIPHTLLTLPTDDAALNGLAYRTIAAIENDEMSNTLMAMCTTLVREWALEHDRPCLWHGYGADGLIGLSNLTHGDFRKKFPEQTDQQWCDYRASLYQHIIPNAMQVANVSRTGDTFWRSIFAHPDVTDFVWACNKLAVPVANAKPLYGGFCDRWVKDGSWRVEGKKVGYYSGSGISKIRLENPVLGDANFRALYKLAKERLS